MFRLVHSQAGSFSASLLRPANYCFYSNIRQYQHSFVIYSISEDVYFLQSDSIFYVNKILVLQRE